MTSLSLIIKISTASFLSKNLTVLDAVQSSTTQNEHGKQHSWWGEGAILDTLD